MFKLSVISLTLFIKFNFILASYNEIHTIMNGYNFNEIDNYYDEDKSNPELNVNLGLIEPIDPSIAEDAKLQVPELIQKYGRPVEVHKVVTEDGYILQMHRMPRPGGKPILLMHGLLDSSSTWVVMGPEKGLGYMLYDLGYDVWMGNARGNHYSRQHVSLNPNKNSKFWQFSFHEIGTIDVPTMIDYILDSTKSEKLQYIGHSQGTVIFWIMCSEKPQYADKIIMMNALAPVAYLDHVRSPLINAVTFLMKNLGRLISWIGPNEFLPNSHFLSYISKVFCRDGALTQNMCSNVIFAITGYNEKEMNKTMLPVMIGHAPAGAATKQIIHFSQISRSGKFQQFDYGYVQNLFKYGSLWPLKYNFKNVQVKVAFHYSLNDYLADESDMLKLYNELPMPVGKFLTGDPEFNHLDFVWGINARPYCYERIVQLIKSSEPELIPTTTLGTTLPEKDISTTVKQNEISSTKTSSGATTLGTTLPEKDISTTVKQNEISSTKTSSGATTLGTTLPEKDISTTVKQNEISSTKTSSRATTLGTTLPEKDISTTVKQNEISSTKTSSGATTLGTTLPEKDISTTVKQNEISSTTTPVPKTLGTSTEIHIPTTDNQNGISSIEYDKNLI